MSSLHLFRNFSFLFLAVALLCLPVYAQDATGRIIGNVTDPSGASISGAKVTVTNAATKISQTTTTNKDGFYQVSSLPIGTYKVAVESEGFRELVFDDQLLQINQTLRVDAKLEVGVRSEVVRVEAQANVVETVNPTLEQSVTGRTLTDMPLNGRNVLDLALLQSGVTPTNDDSGGAGTYNIAGGRADSVAFLLDGGNNNDLLSNGVVFNPNPDTIAEFRILKSDYTAEYGRNGGGVISVVTKSGSNEYHGSAYDFIRNDDLDANLFFNKSNADPTQNLPRPILKRNQFGGTFGGPITIPHVVNGKDRFFFFFGYEGQRQSAQNTSSGVTTFTPAELMGDYSSAGSGGGPAACPNADLNVAAFLQANPVFQSDPNKAMCGIIDPTKINSAAQKYIAAGLIPTAAGGIINSQSSATDNFDQYTLRTDLNVTAKDRISITLGKQTENTLNPYYFADVNGFSALFNRTLYFGNASYTRTISANLVNEFRATAQRNALSNSQPASTLPNPGALGFGITPDNPTGPPILFFDSGLTVGNSPYGPTTEKDNTYAYSDTLSWTHGHHTWKFGGSFSAFQNNTLYDFYVNGSFSFQGQNGIGTGNSFADFLLGIPNSYYQAPAAPSNIRTKFSAGFAQDEWRASKKLTLTLGLRYEYSTPKSDTKGRSYSIIPGEQSTVFPNAPVGLLFPGDKGAPTGSNFPDKTNFAPRVGIAWDPNGDGRTSIRTGFGIFYDILKGEDNLQFNGQPPFFSGASLGFANPNAGPASVCLPPNDCLAAPFAAAGIPNSFPSKPADHNVDFGAAGFLPFNAGGGIYYVAPHLKTPYTYQYNLSVQHQLAPNTLFEVSYVGSSSHGLTSLVDVNPTVLGTYDRVLNLTPGNVSCPMAAITCTDASGNTLYTSLALSPEFKNVAHASYNGLQVGLQQQVLDTKLGKTYFQLGYTFAHSIDDASGFRNRNSEVPAYDPGLFRSSSDFDVKHRITFSGGWDLPLERLWASGPKRLLSGWSIYPIFSWRTGFPKDIFGNVFSSSNLNPGTSGVGDPLLDHANLVGPITYVNPSQTLASTGVTGSALVSCDPSNPSLTCGNFYFNPNSFSTAQNPSIAQGGPSTCTPTPGVFPSDDQAVACPNLRTYGTLSRNVIRAPGQTNLDMSISKVTPLYGERVKLEIRGDFFNIFNHAEFASPDTNIASGTFGQITSTFPQRIIQIAARISF